MTAILAREGQSSDLPYQHLVEEGAWEQFVTLIAQELGINTEHAASRVNETIGFLYLTGTQPYIGPWKGFGPSEQVDEVWHLLMEKLPEELDAFCRKQFGSNITHTPGQGPIIADTLAAMQAAGLPTNLTLWGNPAMHSDCTGATGDSVTRSDWYENEIEGAQGS